MKKYFVLLATVSMLMACNNQGKNGHSTSTENTFSAGVPVIKFDKEVYDFGKIKPGNKVKYSYAFENTGKSPLIITSAVASCGCTIPSPPTKPIAPGEKSAIGVVFDSAGKSGLIDKQITVTANTVPAQTIIHLVGEIEAAK